MTTIKDVGIEYQLVTDSQDVLAIDEYLGQEFTDGHGYFVTVVDGDYDEVLVFDGSVPYLNKEVIRLK